jgi:hypothetical protein
MVISHVKCKGIFAFSSFPLTFVLLLTILWTMSRYPHEVQLNNTCPYVNDMTCSNNYHGHGHNNNECERWKYKPKFKSKHET